MNKMKKKLICIICPAGCTIETETDDAGMVKVSGNKCPRGAEYARKELLSPERTVTAVVPSDSEVLPFIPVRTDKAISKKLVSQLLKTIYSMKVKTPVKRGAVLIEDFLSSGVNVIFSRTVK